MRFDITIKVEFEVLPSELQENKGVQYGTRTYSINAEDEREAIAILSDKLNTEIDLVGVCKVD